MRFVRFALFAASALLAAAPALATVTLGPMQLAYPVKVVRIHSSPSATFVTFTSLPNCVGNGGYVTVSWAAANGGQIDQHRTAQIVATLLFAKATSTTMEVRYRQNSSGTGWDSCAIDSIFLD
jgi:hypothetical protein